MLHLNILFNHSYNTYDRLVLANGL